MKLCLADAILKLAAVLFYLNPLSAGAEKPVGLAEHSDTAAATGRLGEFFSLESVLIVVFVLLVIAVIAHRTRSP